MTSRRSSKLFIDDPLALKTYYTKAKNYENGHNRKRYESSDEIAIPQTPPHQYPARQTLHNGSFHPRQLVQWPYTQ